MIHVVLASDRNVIRHLGVTALSAIRNASRPMSFTLLTPPDDAADPMWRTVISLIRQSGAKCELVPVSLDPSKFQLAAHLTPVTYYRLLLPEVLPATLHRVIYMDCDILVGRDLADLWDTEMHGRAVAAAPDIVFTGWSKLGIDPALGYFNAGLLVIDLNAIRTDGSFASALEFSQSHSEALTWSDQCALNKVFTGRWSKLERHWNYQHCDFLHDIGTVGVRQAKRIASQSVVHFNNYDRPWITGSPHPLKRLYFEVAKAYPALNFSARTPARSYWRMLKRAV